MRGRHSDSSNHRGEQEDSEDDDEREADLGNEFIFAEVLAEGDEGGEVGGG